MRPDQPYSQAHYDYVLGSMMIPPRLKNTDLLHRPITVASEAVVSVGIGQPEASEKTGKAGFRGAYGLSPERR